MRVLCVLLLAVVSFRRFWRSAVSGANGANGKLTLSFTIYWPSKRKAKPLILAEIEMDARKTSEIGMLCLEVEVLWLWMIDLDGGVEEDGCSLD